MPRVPKPPPIYGIADAEALAPTSLPVAVEQMAEAGLRWIQVRAKHSTGRDFATAVEECCRRLEGATVTLWVDDRADVAALFPVRGLHVGQRDLPPGAARKSVGDEVWIGLSTHNQEQLEAAAADSDVDVVAVGPVFSTASKERPDPVVGIDFVHRARERSGKPLVAIGGIGAGNLRRVLDAGADAVAVLSALCRGDVARNSRDLLAAVGNSSAGTGGV